MKRNRRFKNWTIIGGKVYKIRKKWFTHRICPRIAFKCENNGYKEFYCMCDGYRFINKSYYDFRC